MWTSFGAEDVEGCRAPKGFRMGLALDSRGDRDFRTPGNGGTASYLEHTITDYGCPES